MDALAYYISYISYFMVRKFSAKGNGFSYFKAIFHKPNLHLEVLTQLLQATGLDNFYKQNTKKYF